MEGYVSLSGRLRTEKIIEKSRFITTSAHVEGEEEAAVFVASVRAEFKDATHNCYAYIADGGGNFMRFSDDGEPQGTAGMPILEVIKNNSLKQTAVVVTRYFGGIKLGAGGLVRAYSGCTSENLAAARRARYCVCTESVYTVDYPQAAAATRFFASEDCETESADYGDRVRYIVAVKSELAKDFDAAFLNRMCGRAEIKKLREYIRPFDI